MASENSYNFPYQFSSKVLVVSGNMSLGGYVYLRMLVKSFPASFFTILISKESQHAFTEFGFNDLENVSFRVISRFKLGLAFGFNLLESDGANQVLFLNSFGFVFNFSFIKGLQTFILYQNSLLIDGKWGFWPFQPLSLIKKFIFRLNLWCGRKFLVQSVAIKNKLASLFPYGNFIILTVVPGMHSERRTKLNFDKGKKCIRGIYPAVYLPHKNHSILFRSLAELCVPVNVEFYFTFDRSELSDQDVKLVELIDRGCVRFTGAMCYSDYISFLKSVNFVVYPSRVESFGLPIYEAMELGKSVAFSKSIPVDITSIDSSSIYIFDENQVSSVRKSLEILTNDLAESR